MNRNAGTVKAVESRFLWVIKNVFASCKNVGDSLTSPTFSTTECLDISTEYQWNLVMYPKGTSNSGGDCISLFLKYKGQNKVEGNYKLSLLDYEYSIVHEINFQKLYEAGSTSGFRRFVEHNFLTDKINQVLVNDTINILCQITYTSLENKRVGEKEQDSLPDYCRLKEFDKFEKLWEAQNSTDIVVKVGEHEIKVHKLIIMNRSPVFQAMFEDDMKEKDRNVVEIIDIKYEVMKELLRFMYVGEVNDLEKIAGDLLIAAEKYCMKGLKILCEKEIFKNLSIKNAVENLKLADMNNAMDLKTEIIKLIVQNKEDVIHTPEFKLLPAEIECEVLRAIIGINK